jgi:hypothetical protein
MVLSQMPAERLTTGIHKDIAREPQIGWRNSRVIQQISVTETRQAMSQGPSPRWHPMGN